MRRLQTDFVQQQILRQFCWTMNRLSFIVMLWVLAGCATRKNIISAKIQVRFISAYRIPFGQQFNGTTVGGLSGIDFDPSSGKYYIICDDGSKINPARFYTANIKLSDRGIDTVSFLNVTTLLQPDGSLFARGVVDPEAARYDAASRQLFWSSEGIKELNGGKYILKDPFIRVANMQGHFSDSFLLPSNLRMSSTERGPRNNGSFEGLAFSGDHTILYASVEEPLYEDGSKAGAGDSSAMVRIVSFDVKTKSPLAQYAYQIDPVAYPATPAQAFKINGVSDILWAGDNQLLVLERSFSTGRQGCVVKVYLADLATATDVSSVPSLLAKNTYIPIRKKLLVNMEHLNTGIFNVEGLTLGPKLPNGRQSLLFVADDNFSTNDRTQFLLFEIIR